MPRNPPHPFLPDTFFSLFSEIAGSWISGGRNARAAIAVALGSAAAAFFVNVLVGYDILPDRWRVFVDLVVALAISLLVGVIIYRTALRSAAAAELEAVKQRLGIIPINPWLPGIWRG
jgi:hypothetical protein